MKIIEILTEAGYKTVPIKDPLTGKTVWVNKGPDGSRVPGVYTSAKDAEDALTQSKKNPDSQQTKPQKTNTPSKPSKKPQQVPKKTKPGKGIAKSLARLKGIPWFGMVLSSGVIYLQLVTDLTKLQNSLISNGCNWSHPDVKSSRNGVKATLANAIPNFFLYATVPSIIGAIAAIPFFGWIAAAGASAALYAWGDDVNQKILNLLNKAGFIDFLIGWVELRITKELLQDMLTMEIPLPGAIGVLPMTLPPKDGKAACSREDMENAQRKLEDELVKNDNKLEKFGKDLFQDFKQMLS